MKYRDVELAETAGNVKGKLVILLKKQDSKNRSLNNFPTAFLLFLKNIYKMVIYLLFFFFFFSWRYGCISLVWAFDSNFSHLFQVGFQYCMIMLKNEIIKSDVVPPFSDWGEKKSKIKGLFLQMRLVDLQP